MKKFFCITFFGLVLSGCSDRATQFSMPVVPDGLKDCDFYELENARGLRLIVVRCPHSSTTAVPQVKNPTGVTTIDI